MTCIFKRIKTAFALSLLTIGLPVQAQYQIKGTVYDSETNKVLGGVNVLLSHPATHAVVNFTFSDSEGKYFLQTDSTLDSLQISVSGLNIETTTKIIPKGKRSVNFNVRQGMLEIREAIIKTEPIRRTGDTLTYYVEQFRSATDHSIGDILKKMPGITVAHNGNIRYNGIPINRFYIEGLDMFGGKYGIATKNVLAADIATVEIYENHQPVKVLETWERSDQAALNLKLKEEARGTWNGTVETGIGYRPIMWDFCFTPMFFSKEFQTILTYKTNNTGDDVALELSPQYTYGTDIPALLDIVSPSAPPLNAEIWLRNNVHAISANGITKIGEGKEFTLKAHYVHDLQESASFSQTTYCLDGLPAFSISETLSANQAINDFKADLLYRINTAKLYLLESVQFDLNQKEDIGYVLNESGDLTQTAKLPFTKISNRLSYTRGFEKWRLRAHSNTYYAQRNSQLDITPNPYPKDLPTEDISLMQQVLSEKINSSNSANTSFSCRDWIFGISGNLVINLENLSSELGTPDSLKNMINWLRVESGLSASVTWKPVHNLTLDLSLPVKWIYTSLNDRMSGRNNTEKTVPVFSPDMTLKYIYNHDFTMKFTTRHLQTLTGLYDMYSGYIMQNYRSLIAKGGVLNMVRRTSVSYDCSYSNSIYALFANGRASGWLAYREGTYGTRYEGILMKTVFVPEPNSSSGISFDIEGSKRFHSTGTTIKTGASWSRLWNEYHRQGQWMSSVRDNWSSRLELSSRISRSFLALYEGIYNGYRSYLSRNEFIRTIHSFQEKLGINWIIGEKLKVGLSARHYYTSAFESNVRNMFFFNASMGVSMGRWQLMLEGNNLMNMKYYGSAGFNSNTYQSNLYRLRPASVLLKVRFSLR